MGRRLGRAGLGAVVVAGTEKSRTCVNGLPLAPAVVRILGRFSRLQEMDDHPHLCRHVALVRCAMVPNGAILVAEHYEESLADVIENRRLEFDDVLDVAGQISSAVAHLHSNHVSLGILDVSSVRIVPGHGAKLFIRLSQYGYGWLSQGDDMEGLVCSPYTAPPEMIVSRLPSRKGDIWAFGMTVLQMTTGVVFARHWTPLEFSSMLFALCKKGGSIYSLLLAEIEKVSGKAILSFGKVSETIDKCLRIRPSERPTMTEIHEMLGVKEDEPEQEIVYRVEDDGDPEWLLSSMPFEDVFFLWTLSGSPLERLMVSRGMVRLECPVLTSPLLVFDDLLALGNEDGRKFRSRYDVVLLPMGNLREKLLSMPPSEIFHSFELDPDLPSSPDLPVVVKEKDVSYQAIRMRLVSRLLASSSFRPDLLRECVSYDVPPMRRSAVWRDHLGVTEEDKDVFYQLDTVSPHPSDRQLDVDIPRCHQYEELMTSPSAHHKLKRLLKAWLRSHPQYVYWQGLDSLAAPFLLLNFENIPMALACMTKFIDRYLKDFFLKDNSPIIQEYLGLFNQLIAYVDASLYQSLADMDFFPELFAIPWFLTCFAHVLPLHKLFHVWDALLLSDTSFPLFVGVSILTRMRPSLIDASFNDVILLFSDLPDLPIDKMLVDAIQYYNRVPKSCAFLGNGDHSMTRLSVPELKSFTSPRISKDEFIVLVEKGEIAVVDVRPAPDFHRGFVIRSVNYSNIDDTSLSNIRTLLDIAQSNKHPICIIDTKHIQNAKRFASHLVRVGVCGVCILDGGIDGIRHAQSILSAS